MPAAQLRNPERRCVSESNFMLNHTQKLLATKCYWRYLYLKPLVAEYKFHFGVNSYSRCWTYPGDNSFYCT